MNECDIMIYSCQIISVESILYLNSILDELRYVAKINTLSLLD